MIVKVKAVPVGKKRPMKESGVEWMGLIPGTWHISKNKYLLEKMYSGGTPSASNEEYYSEDGIPFVSISDMSSKQLVSETKKKLSEKGRADKNLTILPKGTILYSIYATIGAVSELSIEATISQAILALRLKPAYDKQFYKYNLMAMRDYVFVNANGNTQFNLNAEKVWNFYFAVPPVAEQKRISGYLDLKCGQIDFAIQKTRESIEEYKKLKQSIITETVTKGIRPNRTLKPSESIWFDVIPSNWEMRKIKYLFTIQKRIAGEEGHTVLSITQKGIVPKDLSTNEGQLADNYKNYQLVHIGDFAMNHMDLLTGWVDVSRYEGVTSPDYRVFELNKDVNCDSQYYLYLMQMCYSNRIFYGLGQGVSGMGRWRLQADKFLNFKVAVPPYEEQLEIVEYLDEKIGLIDSVINQKECYIEELQVYKKSLIFEYVTGKKEVV